MEAAVASIGVVLFFAVIAIANLGRRVRRLEKAEDLIVGAVNGLDRRMWFGRRQ